MKNRIASQLYTPHPGSPLAAWAWEEMLLGRYEICVARIGCGAAWLVVMRPDGYVGILFLGLW